MEKKVLLLGENGFSFNTTCGISALMVCRKFFLKVKCDAASMLNYGKPATFLIFYNRILGLEIYLRIKSFSRAMSSMVWRSSSLSFSGFSSIG